ncbi:MAG: FmdB family transcriptional regulator [Massilia sp.]|nr:FmdB family transcriptional regulator [Massilia sp.]
MPIYAYRCDECGFSKDVLQKISDPVLTDCLSCGKSAFKKQVTAAGFQLKGSGWYVTDFRGGKAPAGAPAAATAAAPAAGTSSEAGATATVPAAASPSADAGKSAAPAAASGGDKSAS